MSFDPISAGFDFAGKLVDKFFPDPEKKAQAMLELERMKQTGELALLAASTDLVKGQLQINTEEAKSPLLFVSGWRPFFGWICGVVFLYHFLIQPFIVFLMAASGKTFVLPVFDMEAMMNVTLGILGLGGLRTFEKFKGVTSIGQYK